MEKKGVRFFFKRLLPLGIILSLMVLAYVLGVFNLITFENVQQYHLELSEYVEKHPLLSPLLFIVTYMISTALSIPGGAILSVIGGFLFPLPLSTLYVLIGATIGAMLIFLAAKHALSAFFRQKAGTALKTMEEGFQKNAVSYLLFLRFIPLFPFWLVNIAPAFFNVPLFQYTWTTFIGILPGAFVYTQAGKGLRLIITSGDTLTIESIFNNDVKLALVLLALFTLIPPLVKYFLKKRRNNV